MPKRKSKIRRDYAEDHQVFNSFQNIIPINKSYEHRFKGNQRFAFSVYEQNDVVFLLGPAGSGKSHCSCMFAIGDLVQEKKSRLVLTRPIVEAGKQRLGYLPGTFNDKTDPYMMPLYNCIHKLVPGNSALAELIQSNTEVSPLAYMRGVTFDNSICVLDEAQNCTFDELVLFLTRLGENSKMIITGDPSQTDIGRESALMDVVEKLDGLEGVGIVKFSEKDIVRHKLVGQILKRLQKPPR